MLTTPPPAVRCVRDALICSRCHSCGGYLVPGGRGSACPALAPGRGRVFVCFPERVTSPPEFFDARLLDQLVKEVLRGEPLDGGFRKERPLVGFLTVDGDSDACHDR